MTAATDLPTFEELHAISNRLGGVLDEIGHVVGDAARFLDGCKDDEGNVVTLPTLEQLGALHAFRELIDMDRDELLTCMGKLVEVLIDLNLTRLDAAVQRA
jgi:hypothetical protein